VPVDEAFTVTVVARPQKHSSVKMVERIIYFIKTVLKMRVKRFNFAYFLFVF